MVPLIDARRRLRNMKNHYLLLGLLVVSGMNASRPMLAADPSNLPGPPAHAVPYLARKKSSKHFRFRKGIASNWSSSDPVIKEPVVAVFDGNGRMFVAEMRSYMQDIDGKNEHHARRPRLAALVQQGRRRLRQAHGVRRSAGAAAHDSAAGQRHAGQRNRHQRHLALPRHQWRRRGGRERACSTPAARAAAISSTSRAA